MSKELTEVWGTDPLHKINKAIEMPRVLNSDDREFFINKWEPVVKTGELVIIKIEAVVYIPKEN